MPPFPHRAVTALCLFLLAAGWLPATAQPPRPATLFLPIASRALPRLLLRSAYIDSGRSGEPDEAVEIFNAGAGPETLAGWQLRSGARTTTFPLTTTVAVGPGQSLWCTAQAADFRRQFAAAPGCEWRSDSDPAVPNLTGDLAFTNHGGFIALVAPTGLTVDTLLYGDATNAVAGWEGAPAQLYTRGVLGSAGQLWQRKPDPATLLPFDSNRAGDWAGDLLDLRWGRRIIRPGWAPRPLMPPIAAAEAGLTVAIAPEGTYEPLSAALGRAAATLDLSLYTFEHPQIARLIAQRARAGVRVRLLLDGAPPGGISDLQRWCTALIAAAGGQIYYFAPPVDAPAGLVERYRYSHAKFALIDQTVALLGTENFTLDAMPRPADEPPGGRRGAWLITDAAPVVSGLQEIFDTDWQPGRYFDLRPFVATDPKYGGPPADFVLPEPPVYAVTEAPFVRPVHYQGWARYQLIAAPEQSLSPVTGLFALLARAGAGDRIEWLQLYEHKNWGESSSTAIADPNPRLTALLAAARRGARVRVLLDGYFDEETELRSNRATVDYLNAVAAAEGLDLQARTGNPTLGGIHAKIVLVTVGSETWSVVGSLNGGEVSHKLNRELLLLTDAGPVHARLVQMFDHDWPLGRR
jgi:phosphatidylserine/phosphatidylglycerophosphate/cardiolipin synthase-like enzyme